MSLTTERKNCEHFLALAEDIINLLDMVGTTKVTQGILTLYDIPTELRNRMSKDEQLAVLELMKGRQQRNRERRQRNEIQRSNKSSA
jgi:hypothetical protein